MFGYVAGLPAFLAYFIAGGIMLAAFAGAYAMVTPHKELTLIRTGNGAAVVGFLGALLGFSLPLASAAANSVSIIDFILWAIIGALVQIAAFFLASAMMSDLPKRITNGEMPAGVWVAGVAVAVGLLNAACMTY